MIAEIRGTEGFVDDFAIEPPASWSGEGSSLLTAAWASLTERGCDRLRVVSARRDEKKVAMLLEAGLSLVDEWWVVPVAPAAGHHEAGRVEGPGFAGLLGPAPPVYAPGGNVLLVNELTDVLDPAAIAGFTASLGGVLAIVATGADVARAERLQDEGWTVASAWYLGVPA